MLTYFQEQPRKSKYKNIQFLTYQVYWDRSVYFVDIWVFKTLYTVKGLKIHIYIKLLRWEFFFANDTDVSSVISLDLVPFFPNDFLRTNLQTQSGTKISHRKC